MKNQLLFTFLLLLVVRVGQSQCNPKEYTRIFNEAKVLQEKGEFIESKNRYEAAKIYACNQKEKDAADVQIDALFEQIDRLRYLADSTAETNRRAVLTIYANELAYKSQIALERGDRTTAFRLAEFAHRYVDDSNLNVTKALVDIIYQHDNPANPFLPWAFNFTVPSASDIAFSPDGNLLAIAAGSKIKIWDIFNDKIIVTLEVEEGDFDVNFGICSLAFSPDGKLIAAGFTDATAKIWDLYSGKQVETLSGHGAFVACIAFSPDGKQLATGSMDSSVIIWDLQTKNKSLVLNGHRYRVNGVAFSPDGKFLATGSLDSTTIIWNLKSKKEHFVLSDHLESVNSVAFSRDGKRLATSSWDNTAKIWDMESGKLVLTLSGHVGSVNNIAFSPNGKWLATCADDKKIKIWDILSGKIITTLGGHTNSINNVTFSPNGKQLATVSSDETVRIWDIDTDRQESSFKENNHLGIKDSMTLESRKVVLELHGFCYAFSPDGKKIAAGYGNYSDEGHVIIWDIESGKQISTFLAHHIGVFCIAFSHDGKILATGSLDQSAKLWDLESGKEILTLSGHTDLIRCIAFSPDNKKIATGSNDKTAKVWDLQTGKEILTLFGPNSEVDKIVFSPNGKSLITEHLDDDNTVKIWDLDPDTLIDKGRRHRLASLTLSQLESYNLQNLLDLHPENEDKLIATGDIWQIKAFADLTASLAFSNKKLTRLEPYYARAERLYVAALSVANEALIREDYAVFLKRWAEGILESNRPDASFRHIKLASHLSSDKSQCLKLWANFSEKTGLAFDLYRFIDSTDIEELNSYVAFFIKKGEDFVKTKDWVPGYQNALLLREKQMRLDTTSALRMTVSIEYNNLGYYQLFLPDGKAAETSIRHSLKLDPTNKFPHTKLAIALLLQGKSKEAETEIKKWSPLPFNEEDRPTYREAFLKVLKDMEEEQVTGINYAQVRSWLK